MVLLFLPQMNQLELEVACLPSLNAGFDPSCLLSELLVSTRKNLHSWPLSSEPGILGLAAGRRPQGIKNVVLLARLSCEGAGLSVTMTGLESCSQAGSEGWTSSQL